MEQAKRAEELRRRMAEEALRRKQEEYEQKRLEQERSRAAEAEIERLRLQLKRQELSARHTDGVPFTNSASALETDDLFQPHRQKKPLSLFDGKTENELLSFADEDDLPLSEKKTVVPRKPAQQARTTAGNRTNGSLLKHEKNEIKEEIDADEKDFDFAAYISKEKASATKQKKIDIFGDDDDVF